MTRSLLKPSPTVSQSDVDSAENLTKEQYNNQLIPWNFGALSVSRANTRVAMINHEDNNDEGAKEEVKHVFT